ncbi:MAG: CRISPR-associated endonuclease Cas2 [Candidatus Methanomethylicota archaeon]|jgi:CRISPR-associated protein Cas2|uniref:CRISPR-associated endoribonuclease Cas2 n=1 Tax=Thermoproteota archaeon TaxID=2056631 RepID=A0A523BHB6_9CREN|nr:MAG: CRISPR-associated endonuclease Cas2 [Candidatus Verstraetearchaeota archaeon]
MTQLMTLVIYDIENDKLRSDVANFLKSKGLKRIQYSAFIGCLTDSQRIDLIAGLRRLVKDGRNNVQIFPLTQASYNMRTIIGSPLYDEAEEEDIVVT